MQETKEAAIEEAISNGTANETELQYPILAQSSDGKSRGALADARALVLASSRGFSVSQRHLAGQGRRRTGEDDRVAFEPFSCSGHASAGAAEAPGTVAHGIPGLAARCLRGG